MMDEEDTSRTRSLEVGLRAEEVLIANGDQQRESSSSVIEIMAS